MNQQSAAEITLQDYVSGGYYLAQFKQPGVERPPSPKLPKRYISASGCHCRFFPDSWAWSYAGPQDDEGNLLRGISRFEERLAHARYFGITADQLPDVIRWGHFCGGSEFGFPTGFYRLLHARKATEWINIPPEEYVIFGIGLHHTMVEKFLHDTKDYATCTIPICLKEGIPLQNTGKILGHELLDVFNGHLSESWICGGMEDILETYMHVKVNEHGYIDSFEIARVFARKIEQECNPEKPEVWYPWLIVSY